MSAVEFEPLVRPEDVAEYLGVRVSWVREAARSDPTFPVKRVGRYLRFRLSEIDKWVEAQR